jgi:hypothetical protein
MKKQPIRRVEREQLSDRKESRLSSAWVSADGEKESAGSAPCAHLFRSEKPSPFSVDPGAPVLVMMHGQHDAALAELLAPAAAGERVYLLTQERFGQRTQPVDPQILACPSVLVRRIKEVPVSGVYRSGEAKLWLGATPEGPAPWCLRLDAEQAAAFRHLFLWLFWHHASTEGWTGGKQLVFREAAERPFDIPAPLRTAPIRIQSATENPAFDAAGALVHTASLSIPTAAPQRLWFPCSGQHHSKLAQLVARGTEVVWDSRELPNLVVSSSRGVAWLSGWAQPLVITLNPDQMADAAHILSDSAAWRFETSVRLGDHADRDGVLFWLDGATSASPFVREQVMELPSVQAKDLRSTRELVPDSFPNPQPLALSVRYKWTVIPPRVLGGAGEDPLVLNWRKVDAEFQVRCASLRASLKETEGQRSKLGSRFVRLLGALLGFERSQKQTLLALDDLEKQTPSVLGPDLATELYRRLDGLATKAVDLQSALDETARKAEEDEAREAQKRDWEKRTEDARKQLPESRKELAELKEKQAAQTQQLAELEEKLSAAEKEEQKDLRAHQKKTKDELAKREKNIEQLAERILNLEEQAQAPFVFVPPEKPTLRSKKESGRFVPEIDVHKATFDIPEDALPEVGKLCRVKGARYLVLDDWEDLQLGEQAASRLRAGLVAPENA